VSTSESLSQNEIDLLFSGGGGEPGGSEVDRRQSEVQVYDFRRPARISKDRMRSLKAMYGLLAKSLESWITGRMRDQLELELQSVEQLSFGEFQLALPSPCSSYILDIQGTGRQGVIDFGHEFAYFIVDRLFGGTGQHTVPSRTLSAIERMAVRIVADRVAFHLAEAWKDYVRLALEVSGFESIPEMLQVANREDPVLVANLSVGMGDMHSLMMLCLPFAAVEKFFTGTSARRPAQPEGSESERARERTVLETTVRDAQVLVQARLPRFNVSFRDLLGLEPGSVLSTGLEPDSELEVIMAGQRRFRGLPGKIGRTLAVRVSEAVDPEPDDLIHPERGSAADR
jgi:flagellar motor switch protein FliM